MLNISKIIAGVTYRNSSLSNKNCYHLLTIMSFQSIMKVAHVTWVLNTLLGFESCAGKEAFVASDDLFAGL